MKKNMEDISKFNNMQEQEENIQFDNMPDFGGMFENKPENWDDDKVYDSLYDELCDKCRPDRFINESPDNKKFIMANQLYSELKNKKGCSDNELIEFRDRAMSLLGIRISTKKLYEWLEHYLNPKVYTTMEPYDSNRVALAGDYYMRMREYKNNIHTLEKLRDEASTFIDKRIEEEKILLEKQKDEENKARTEKENQRDALIMVCIMCVLVIIILIAML